MMLHDVWSCRYAIFVTITVYWLAWVDGGNDVFPCYFHSTFTSLTIILNIFYIITMGLCMYISQISNWCLLHSLHCNTMLRNVVKSIIDAW